jgi:hypothetical protein
MKFQFHLSSSAIWLLFQQVVVGIVFHWISSVFKMLVIIVACSEKWRENDGDKSGSCLALADTDKHLSVVIPASSGQYLVSLRAG